MKTRNVAAHSLQIRAQSLDYEARTVEVTMATEAPVRVWDRRHGTILEVLRTDGARFAAQVPLLDNHRRESVDDVIGSIVLRREGDEVVGLARFDDDNGIAERTLRKIQRGHLTDFSIGYEVVESEMVAPGSSSEIGGRSYRAEERALRVATVYEIKEGSATPIGADALAKVRMDGDHEEDRMDEEDEHEKADPKPEEEEEKADNPEPDGEEEEEEEPEMGEKSHPVTVNRGAVDLEGALHRERQRAAEIMAIGGNEEILKRAVADGWTVNKAKAAMLDHERNHRFSPVSSGPEVIVRSQPGGDKQDKIRALAAGLFLQTSEDGDPLKMGGTRKQRKAWTNARKEQNEKAADHAMRKQYDQLSFGGYMAELYETTTGKRAPRGDLALIDACRAAISVVDLNNVFTTTFQAVLVNTYEEAMPTITQIAKEEDVPDFRQNERPRMGQLGFLQKLNVGGIAEHFGRSDIVEYFTAKRYSGQAAFDEQDILSDRLGAFRDFPMQMGRSAVRVPADLVTYILQNGEVGGIEAGAIFSSGNGNLNTSSALSSANLQAAITDMWVQQEDSVNLNLSPEFLIVPPNLVWTARELIESATILYGADDESVRGSKNVLMGQLKIISDARLQNGVTDPDSGSAGTGSATSYYLSAGGANREICLGYVRGSGRVPRVRSYVLDKGQYGLGWDVSLDVGAGTLGYRGLHKSNA